MGLGTALDPCNEYSTCAYGMLICSLSGRYSSVHHATPLVTAKMQSADLQAWTGSISACSARMPQSMYKHSSRFSLYCYTLLWTDTMHIPTLLRLNLHTLIPAPAPATHAPGHMGRGSCCIVQWCIWREPVGGLEHVHVRQAHAGVEVRVHCISWQAHAAQLRCLRPCSARLPAAMHLPDSTVDCKAQAVHPIICSSAHL
jgi:hypothetical protein